MQREIQWYMRPYLIDFIVEAHAAFLLLPETLFLTINLLDRYCSKRVVHKHHYQLVGCAALLIAAKYGDKKDRVPQIAELSNMCCGLYDAGMFTQMEIHVLTTLEWVIGHPTVDFFSKLMVAYEHDDKDVHFMSSYLCEIALYHREFVSMKPSVLARTSLALARSILGRQEPKHGDWDASENWTLITMHRHLDQPSPTLVQKYSSSIRRRTSQKLADYVAERAAQAKARQIANMPSPPAETGTNQGDIYSTPHKPHGPPSHGAIMGLDGYLTPPITPDGASFGNMGKDPCPLPPRCPVTPTPQNRHAAVCCAQPVHQTNVPVQQACPPP